MLKRPKTSTCNTPIRRSVRFAPQALLHNSIGLFDKIVGDLSSHALLLFTPAPCEAQASKEQFSKIAFAIRLQVRESELA